MAQFYSRPELADDPHALPDAETFYVAPDSLLLMQSDSGITEPGWYFWFCLPGCMPDGDPEGPFASEREAIVAAQFCAAFGAVDVESR